MSGEALCSGVRCGGECLAARVDVAALLWESRRIVRWRDCLARL